MKHLNLYTTLFFLCLSIPFFSFKGEKINFADVRIRVSNGLSNENGCDGSLPIPCDLAAVSPSTVLPSNDSAAYIRINESDKVEMEFLKYHINSVMVQQLEKGVFSFYADFIINDELIVQGLDPTASILVLKNGNYSVIEKSESYLITMDYLKYK